MEGEHLRAVALRPELCCSSLYVTEPVGDFTIRAAVHVDKQHLGAPVDSVAPQRSPSMLYGDGSATRRHVTGFGRGLDLPLEL
ncbi:hypothetical protein GCM10027562_27290 [Arthrobacter pigmenti]